MRNRTPLITIFTLLLAVTIFLVSSYFYSSNVNNSDDVCTTPGCARAASQALELMDLSVDPCDDFYSFACGNFVKNTKIPDVKNSVGAFTVIGVKVQDQLHSLIGEKISANDLPSFKIAKRLYNTCMDESTIEKHGKEPLISMTEKLGGWPVVEGDKWNPKWNWTEAIIKSHRFGYGTDYVLSVSVGTDMKNTSSRKIYVSENSTRHCSFASFKHKHAFSHLVQTLFSYRFIQLH